MPNVKTAISIDESLYQRAERLVEELQISRSRLYARALEEYVQRHENRRLLRELNAVYGDGMDPDDREFLNRARQHMGHLLKDDEWW